MWKFLDPKTVAGVSRRTGNNALAAEYIYNGRDIDVLFVGSSQIRAGVKHKSLRESYRARTGKDIDTLTIAHNWDGLDLVFFKLRDYLENNKVSLVVVESPNYDSETGNYPHPDSKFFFRISDDSAFFRNLPSSVSLKLYAEQILVAPRLLFGTIFGETGEDSMQAQVARDRGALLRKQGFQGQPFQEVSFSTPCHLSVDDTLLPTTLPDEKLFGPPMQPWERVFLEAMDKLLKQHETKAVFLRLPYIHFADTGVLERNSDFPAFWNSFALTNDQLFGPQPLKAFYYDAAHFNINGAARVGECMGAVLANMEDQGLVSFE